MDKDIFVVSNQVSKYAYDDEGNKVDMSNPVMIYAADTMDDAIDVVTDLLARDFNDRKYNIDKAFIKSMMSMSSQMKCELEGSFENFFLYVYPDSIEWQMKKTNDYIEYKISKVPAGKLKN